MWKFHHSFALFFRLFKSYPPFLRNFPTSPFGQNSKVIHILHSILRFFSSCARFFRNCTFFLLKFSTICKLRWCTTPIYPQQGWISRVKFRFGGRILLFFDKTLHKFSFFRQRLCTAKIGVFLKLSTFCIVFHTVYNFFSPSRFTKSGFYAFCTLTCPLLVREALFFCIEKARSKKATGTSKVVCSFVRLSSLICSKSGC